MSDIAALREAEFAKYEHAYKSAKYHMKPGRLSDALRDLSTAPCGGSYLDVSCGKGEMLVEALRLGFTVARGTEIVPALLDGERIVRAQADSLPFEDKSFDVVSLFDVIEHLIPGDDRLACLELARVARRAVVLTASNRPSYNDRGEDLHINRRPYEEWDALFRQWFPGKVTWLKGPRDYFGEGWRVDL